MSKNKNIPIEEDSAEIKNIIDEVEELSQYSNDDDYDEISAEDCVSLEVRNSNEVSSEEIQNKLDNAISDMCHNLWGYSETGLAARKAAITLAQTRNGLYCRIPLICKGAGCPYRDTCKMLDYGLAPRGEYCPLETSQIELTVKRYAEEFEIGENDYTDQSILREIVNLEIMMERCKALMAIEQNPVVEVISGISECGDTWTHPEVSKAFEIYDRCLRQHTSMLNQMNATRKDKRGATAVVGATIGDVLAQIREIEQNGGFTEDKDPMEVQYEDKTY